MPPLIVDEFTELKISRERKRQLRNEKKGLCRCGKEPLVSDASLGVSCLLAARRRMRRVNGCRPKEIGGSGRTQLIPD